MAKIKVNVKSIDVIKGKLSGARAGLEAAYQIAKEASERGASISGNSFKNKLSDIIATFDKEVLSLASDTTLPEDSDSSNNG